LFFHFTFHFWVVPRTTTTTSSWEGSSFSQSFDFISEFSNELVLGTFVNFGFVLDGLNLIGISEGT
jgi:hypothetical protein